MATMGVTAAASHSRNRYHRQHRPQPLRNSAIALWLAGAQNIMPANAYSYFTTNSDLKSAVTDYIINGASSSTRTTYGDPMNTWDVSRVTDFSEVFTVYTTFNEDLSGWDTSSATSMSSMFSEASTFNRNIGNWDVGKVTDFSFMFDGAGAPMAFNQDISGWDTSSATTTYGMFAYANAFNQNLATWDVSKITDFSLMFFEASSFNQNLCNWGLHMQKSGIVVTGMFTDTGCSSTSNPALVSSSYYSPLCTSVCTLPAPTPAPTRAPTPTPTFATAATPQPTQGPTTPPTPKPSTVPTPLPTAIPTQKPTQACKVDCKRMLGRTGMKIHRQIGVLNTSCSSRCINPSALLLWQASGWHCGTCQ